jgi:(R,R)-butanediol dehydrogenase/meso-butanediol dehydrogenase/diacetyl reductase
LGSEDGVTNDARERTMLGAVLGGPRDLQVRELPDPDPGFGDVRVRVALAGLCGSDVHVWRTGEFVTRFPVVPGHEVTGVIETVGEGCEHLASRRVVLDSRVPCRNCARCLEGQLQRCPTIGFLGEVCDGGFAQSVVVPGDRVWTISDGLPFEVAVLAEPTAVALHAWSRLRSVAGDVERVAILGAGPIGVLQALVIPEAIEVVIVEPHRGRAAVARGITGRSVVAPDALPAGADGFDACFDCAGARGSIATAASMVRPGGTVAAVALHDYPEELDTNAVIAREIVITGAHVFADEMPETLKLLGSRAGRFAPVVNRTVGLEELPEIVASAADGRQHHLKLVVAP